MAAIIQNPLDASGEYQKLQNDPAYAGGQYYGRAPEGIIDLSTQKIVNQQNIKSGLGVEAGTGTYNPNLSSTTISNVTANNTLKPALNNRLDTLSDKGRTTYQDANGYERYRDTGELAPVPEGASVNEGSYYEGEKKYAAPAGDTSIEDRQTNDLIESMKKSLDATTAEHITAIQQQYEAYKAQQRIVNDQTEKARLQGLLTSGASQYAIQSSEAVMQAQRTYSLNEIQRLDAEENGLIAQARATQQQGKFQLMDKQLTLAENKRKEKQQAAKDMADRIAKETQNQKEYQLKISEMLQKSEIENNKILEDVAKSGTATSEQIKEISDAIQNGKDKGTIYGLAAPFLSTGLEKELKQAQLNNIRSEIAERTRKANMKPADELSQEDMLAYAQQMAADGKLQPGSPKGILPDVLRMAKELPKPTGTIVDINTWIRSTKVNETQQAGFAAGYDAYLKLQELKELDRERIKGLLPALGGKVFGSAAQQRYIDLRGEIIQSIRQARSGQAFSMAESEEYENKLPGRIGGQPFAGVPGLLGLIGADSQVKIGDLIHSVEGSLQNKMRANGLAMYGFSKVNIGGTDYRVGDVVDDGTGKRYRINPDGTGTQL